MRSILIVDDEPEIIACLTRLFRSVGLEVSAASDAKAALELAQLFRFDLVLTDVRLPYMNGLEFVRRLKRFHAGPIILLTGLLDSETKSLAIKANVFSAVEKPFDSRELLNLIKCAILKEAEEKFAA
jgi:DNA-binding response OmpR family regulator